jgi:hypothetical protein
VQLQAEHPPQQAKVIAEFKQQVVQQTTPFTQFEPATRLPLGADPILVRALRFEQQESQQVLHLDLTGSKTLSLKLNEELLAKLRMLLTTIAEKSSWGIASNGQLAPSPAQANPSGSAPNETGEGDSSKPVGPKRLLH